MKNFNPKATLIHYSVAVSLEDFNALSLYDHAYIWNDELAGAPRIDEALYKLGCNDVDYNGHFGAALYFSLEPSNDTPETWKAIEAEFDKYIGIARKWQEENKVDK